MRLGLTLGYAARQLGSDGSSIARSTGYLAVCVAALVSFAVLMPSLEYQHVRGPSVSTYDVWVTGPLERRDLEALESRPGVDRVVPALSLTLDALRGPRTSERENGAGVTAIAYERISQASAGTHPTSLLLEGRTPGEGEWACDWSTAKRLSLRVGDNVTAETALLGGRTPLTGRLAGIYGPTGTLANAVLMPVEDPLEDALERAGLAPWTDAFVTCEDPASLEAAFAQGPDADRLLAIARSDLASEARSRLAQEVGPFLRNAATWTAVAGFVALALWQQAARFARRRREYAVLAALGCTPRDLIALDAIEQTLRLGAAATLGCAGAILIVQEVNHAFVPRGTLAGAIVVVAATVLLTVIAGATSLRVRLHRHPLGDALAREGV